VHTRRSVLISVRRVIRGNFGSGGNFGTRALGVNQTNDDVTKYATIGIYSIPMDANADVNSVRKSQNRENSSFRLPGTYVLFFTLFLTVSDFSC
jgi:hypothetical protein